MMTTSVTGRVCGCLLLFSSLSLLSSCSGTSARMQAAAPAPAPSVPKSFGSPSRILPLASGTDAFVTRMLAASKARRSLDLQYYIWHGDQTGKLLAGAVYQAAGRGVKCRLLLDDMGTGADDLALLALDDHPNIEVRLFNPIRLRSARLLGTLLDFKRVNRRMHNKSFTVDGVVTIVGGRNIGDEYFGAAEDMNFTDLDVAASGPVVREVTDSFEAYWNSPSSVPITEVSSKRATEEDVQRSVAALRAHHQEMQGTPYAAALRASPLLHTPLQDIARFQGRAIIVSDDPRKAFTPAEDNATHLAPQLRQIMGQLQNGVILVSPYFIPGKEGVEWFAGLRKRGLDVTVITNSLGSTDVAAVHAGYTRYRKKLLDLGVKIYELKEAPSSKESATSTSLSLTGSSKAGLHAKTFVFDRRWVFVGSMNLDPRSLRLNTEIGMVIDSPELASQMIRQLQANMEERAWRVENTPEGLQWSSKEAGRPVARSKEPGSGFLKKLMWKISSCLPIESQL